MESRSPEERAREARGSGLKEVLHLLFKHKAKIVSVFLSVVFAVTAISFRTAPSYEAKSSLLVKIGREYFSTPEVGEARPFLSLQQEEVINSEIQILTSRELIGKVIEIMGIETLYPGLEKNLPKGADPLEAAIGAFGGKLQVEGIRKSNVIEVAFRHGNPKTAADAVNLLVDLFKEKHLQVFSNPRFSFLEGQLRVSEGKLRESEKRLEAFRQANRVYAFDEQRTLLIRQRLDLDASLKSVRSRTDALREKLASLETSKRTSAASEVLYTDSERERVVTDAKARLLALRLKEQELLRAYNDGSRVVANVRREIGLVEKFLKEQEDAIGKAVRTGNPVYQEVEKERIRTEAELKGLAAEAQTLERQLGQLDGELASLSLQERGFQDLSRDLAMSEKTFQSYAERLEEARISDDMDRNKLANISVIHAAAPPAEPVAPKKALNIAVGILMGAIMGLALAFFSEQTSQSLSTPDDVERRLGLPVLATVSYKK